MSSEINIILRYTYVGTVGENIHCDKNDHKKPPVTFTVACAPTVTRSVFMRRFRLFSEHCRKGDKVISRLEMMLQLFAFGDKSLV